MHVRIVKAHKEECFSITWLQYLGNRINVQQTMSYNKYIVITLMHIGTGSIECLRLSVRPPARNTILPPADYLLLPHQKELWILFYIYFIDGYISCLCNIYRELFQRIILKVNTLCKYPHMYMSIAHLSSRLGFCPAGDLLEKLCCNWLSVFISVKPPLQVICQALNCGQLSLRVALGLFWIPTKIEVNEPFTLFIIWTNFQNHQKATFNIVFYCPYG